MGCAVSIYDVGLVALGHEALVVDEKHDGRHWDDAVFFLHGGSGVVELEALAELVVDRWRRGFESTLQDAVELAGAGDVLRAFFDFERFLEDVINRATSFCGAGDERGVVQEK